MDKINWIKNQWTKFSGLNSVDKIQWIKFNGSNSLDEIQHIKFRDKDQQIKFSG